MKEGSKYIVVYPSTEIRIVCPYCEAKGKVKSDMPPEKDFVITCPKCKERIEVRLNLRSFYRKNVAIEADYQVVGVSRPPRKGTILNISTTGLSIRCYKSLYEKAGHFMSVSFALPPKNEQLKVTGEIVNVIEETAKTITLGLKFEDMGLHEEMEIGLFMRP